MHDSSGDYLAMREGIDAALDGHELVVCDGTYSGGGVSDQADLGILLADWGCVSEL